MGGNSSEREPSNQNDHLAQDENFTAETTNKQLMLSYAQKNFHFEDTKLRFNALIENSYSGDVASIKDFYLQPRNVKLLHFVLF